MLRSSTSTALGIGLLLLAGCDLLGSSSEPTFEGRLLPLAPGAQWSLVPAYVDSSGTDTARVEVISTTEIEGRTYFALHGLTGEEAILLREGERGHVYRRQEGDEVLWLDPSVQGDSTYKYGALNVHVSMLDSVTTPVGTFTHCLRFVCDHPEWVDDRRSYILKPGLGFVRRGGAWIGRWNLASYEVRGD